MRIFLDVQHAADSLGNLQTECKVTFNRIFSCFKRYKACIFLLFTESQVEKLLPPADPSHSDDRIVASARLNYGMLKIVPLFLALTSILEKER
jgi:hypothetical protein